MTMEEFEVVGQQGSGGRNTIGASFDINQERPTLVIEENSNFNQSNIIESVKQLFISRARTIGEVRSIHFCLSGDKRKIQIWVIVDEENLEVSGGVFDIEYDLREIFSETSIKAKILKVKEAEEMLPSRAEEVFNRESSPEFGEYDQSV